MRERVVLVGVDVPSRTSWPLEDRLDELAELARSAGGEVVATVSQRRDAVDPATVIGRGKLEELRATCEQAAADLVVFDRELSPAQVRSVERAVGRRVIDRTQLILDIFARRAHTREGKLQVELAQLTYLLPRLAGRGGELSRLGGGIGTRGPGETKLETDRRRIRVRIEDLRREIAGVARQRAQRRGRRRALGVPTVALVGYTNAGKSTLFERLTGCSTFVADQLFATLDPTTRRLALPGGRAALLTDTVGFVHDLPHHLVAAFRATLEEVVEADVLLHVVDASHPRAPAMLAAAFGVLQQLEATDKPVITVLNKVDRLDRPPEPRRWLLGGPVVAVSALHGTGLDRLREAVAGALDDRYVRSRFSIPYAAAQLVGELHAAGRVIDIRYGPRAIEVEADVEARVAARVGRRLAQLAPASGR